MSLSSHQVQVTRAARALLSCAVVLCVVAAAPAAAGLAAPGTSSGSASAGPASSQHGEEAETGTQAQHEPQASTEQDAAGQQHAQEAEHGEEGEHRAEGMTWGEVIFRWINFALLAGLLYWVLVVPPPFIREVFSFAGLSAIFVQRSEAIAEAKELARRQTQEAEQILQQSETRLMRIEGEVAELVDQARQDAEREKNRAEEDGQAQSEKIRELSRRELRAETLSVQRKLKAFVAELAVGMAEKLLREHMTRADQERLVEDYVSRLGRSMG